MKYIETFKIGKEEAYFGMIERNGTTTYKVGINSYGSTPHSPRSSGYKNFDEAKETFEFYKELISNQ